ncbi:hypothetical protein GPALN_005413 [Globodera pallida]|nr:hypothetical protein GPALN_005413 [Globodera pallida]
MFAPAHRSISTEADLDGKIEEAMLGGLFFLSFILFHLRILFSTTSFIHWLHLLHIFVGHIQILESSISCSFARQHSNKAFFDRFDPSQHQQTIVTIFYNIRAVLLIIVHVPHYYSSAIRQRTSDELNNLHNSGALRPSPTTNPSAMPPATFQTVTKNWRTITAFAETKIENAESAGEATTDKKGTEWSLAASPCPPHFGRSYCYNGGDCYMLAETSQNHSPMCRYVFIVYCAQSDEKAKKMAVYLFHGIKGNAQKCSSSFLWKQPRGEDNSIY